MYIIQLLVVAFYVYVSTHVICLSTMNINVQCYKFSGENNFLSLLLGPRVAIGGSLGAKSVELTLSNMELRNLRSHGWMATRIPSPVLFCVFIMRISPLSLDPHTREMRLVSLGQSTRE